MTRLSPFDFLMARLPECIKALRDGEGRPEQCYARLSRAVPELEFKVHYETFLHFFPVLDALARAVTQGTEDLMEELSDDQTPGD